MASSLFHVRVPKRNWSGNGGDARSTLMTWNWRWKFPTQFSGLHLDFSDAEFLEPWALAMFTSYALHCKSIPGFNVKLTLSPSNPSNTYISDMGICEVVETGKSVTKWDDSHQNTGLHVIHSHDDVTRFVNSAVRLGAGPDDETMDALKYSMAELGRNVVQHARCPVGGVAIAQYFPDRRAIQVSMCDTGDGILASLTRTYPELVNSLESLKLAVLPHVSGAFRHGTYSASDNAGLGLFFTKEICWRAQGSFWLASKDALLGVKSADDSGQNRVYKKINSWKGTLVTLDFPSTGVEDFADLLSLCRTLAADARKTSGPSGVDFLTKPPDIEGIHIIEVGGFREDVGRAAQVRDTEIRPRIERGEMVIIDFGGTRFVTQSFVHALLNDVFKIPGSLVRISFLNCTRSTEEAVRAVAAYAASYRICVDD